MLPARYANWLEMWYFKCSVLIQCIICAMEALEAFQGSLWQKEAIEYQCPAVHKILRHAHYLNGTNDGVLHCLGPQLSNAFIIKRRNENMPKCLLDAAAVCCDAQYVTVSKTSYAKGGRSIIVVGSFRLLVIRVSHFLLWFRKDSSRLQQIFLSGTITTLSVRPTVLARHIHWQQPYNWKNKALHFVVLYMNAYSLFMIPVVFIIFLDGCRSQEAPWQSKWRDDSTICCIDDFNNRQSIC